LSSRTKDRRAVTFKLQQLSKVTKKKDFRYSNIFLSRKNE
jgi:hypothetical protein